MALTISTRFQLTAADKQGLEEAAVGAKLPAAAGTALGMLLAESGDLPVDAEARRAKLKGVAEGLGFTEKYVAAASAYVTTQLRKDAAISFLFLGALGAAEQTAPLRSLVDDALKDAKDPHNSGHCLADVVGHEDEIVAAAARALQGETRVVSGIGIGASNLTGFYSACVRFEDGTSKQLDWRLDDQRMAGGMVPK